jgi:hypothetical protein
MCKQKASKVQEAAPRKEHQHCVTRHPSDFQRAKSRGSTSSILRPCGCNDRIGRLATRLQCLSLSLVQVGGESK